MLTIWFVSDSPNGLDTGDPNWGVVGVPMFSRYLNEEFI
tara:strand:+ start:399 stop:515 length:117 start_codon:yes stop_codon:yes gene_type:complete